MTKREDKQKVKKPVAEKSADKQPTKAEKPAENEVVAKAMSRRQLAIGLAILVAVVGIVVLAVITRKPPSMTNDEIVLQVSRELGISGDSNPSILIVEDRTKVDQPFLASAENGDKILLYYKAGKAVIWRPSQNEIVHSGSYTPPDAKVFIRRGTSEDARVSEIKDKLNSVGEIEIVSQDSSTKKDYQGVTIVSVTDRYDDKIRELEKLFGTKVVRLPQGETFPDADILIIVGN